MNCVKCERKVSEGRYCPFCGWDQSRSVAFPIHTLGELHEHWKKLHYRRIGAKSRETYDTSWRKLEKYADVFVEHITAVEYQEIIDECAGASRSAQQKIKNLCSQLCKHAMTFGLLQVNFAAFLILDGYNSRETEIFSDEEISKLITYANDKGNEFWYAARVTLCLIFTGFRPNEFFDIQKETVNLKENILIGGSKTKMGKNRIIPILPPIRKYIVEWYLSRKSSTKEIKHYLVESEKGHRMDLHNWRVREFYPLMADLGINPPYMNLQKDYCPRIRPYSARHTFATIAYRSGVRPEVIQKLVGHVSFDFTSKVYIHGSVPDLREETQKISVLFGERISCL
ncbi:MAG: site-specific integrase [Oscillospiraceae bacterium]